MATRSMGGVVSDYSHLRTIPAMLSIVFALASMYQFGGFGADLTLAWVGHTVTDQQAVLASLGALAVAFASSETKSLEMYEDWEKALIAGGPALIVAHAYVPEVTNFIANAGTLGQVTAFAVTVAGWGVAVR